MRLGRRQRRALRLRRIRGAAIRAAVSRTTPSGALLGAAERLAPEHALALFLGAARGPGRSRRAASRPARRRTSASSTARGARRATSRRASTCARRGARGASSTKRDRASCLAAVYTCLLSRSPACLVWVRFGPVGKLRRPLAGALDEVRITTRARRAGVSTLAAAVLAASWSVPAAAEDDAVGSELREGEVITFDGVARLETLPPRGALAAPRLHLLRGHAARDRPALRRLLAAAGLQGRDAGEPRQVEDRPGREASRATSPASRSRSTRSTARATRTPASRSPGASTTAGRAPAASRSGATRTGIAASSSRSTTRAPRA